MTADKPEDRPLLAEVIEIMKDPANREEFERSYSEDVKPPKKSEPEKSEGNYTPY